MTGPEHARKALELVEYSEQPMWKTDNGERTPTEDERHRVLLEAHLHASLARTAALTDATHYNNGTYRTHATEQEWHAFFDVNSHVRRLR